MKPRPYLSLGRVVNLTSGSDSLVRSALIKRSDGSTQEHSLKNLCPLELSITHSHQASNDGEGNSLSSGTSRDRENFRSRPVRSVKSLNERNPEYVWY